MDPRLGIIGTSWWVDSMYLPALADVASVVAIAGRDRRRALARAEQWSIPGVYDDWRRMLAAADLDGLIVAAANPVHYPATKEALERGLHVVCEKPVADTYAQAVELAELAARSGAITLVPFTYAYMPSFRYLHHLVAAGFVGRIHHLSLRYHTGYALERRYRWKLDAGVNPSGALGDVGSHFVYLALQLAGEVDWVLADLATVGDAHPRRPDGTEAPPAPDLAQVILGFASGARGLVEASVVSWEGTSMNQRHRLEVHGDEGTLAMHIDWDAVQEVVGSRVGEGPVRPLPIPDEFWGGVRRHPVHDTYRDVFRRTDAMARGWVEALRRGSQIRPDLGDGAAVQAVIEAALRSQREHRRVAVAEVTG